MPTVKDVLDLAMSQVGITEYPPNSNDVVYNTAFYGHAVRDGEPKSNSTYPWCAVFVWWLFSQFSPCLIPKTASCMELGQWFKDNGRWIEPGYEQPGDIAFYKFPTNNRWTNHTGITTEVLGKCDINAVEGNTSVGNDCNGGSVRVRHRTSNIVGFGRPDYDAITKPATKDYKQGIDVSEYQGYIDWAKVKESGISFACMRSTNKNGSVDPTFERNLAGCMEHGIEYSCYKYSYAQTHDQARIEADGVINLLNGRKMPIWLDLEDKSQLPLGKEMIEGIALSFIGECKDAGYDVGIYCNKNWYDNYISQFLKDRFSFWIARYKKNDDGQIHEDIMPDWKNVIAWQYSSKGHVPGIEGNVDRDILL